MNCIDYFTNQELKNKLKNAQDIRLKEKKEEVKEIKQDSIKHTDADFCISDIFGDISIKDDVATMEHPIFALKGGDTKIRLYEHNQNSLTIIPSSLGHPTIFDKDILIYCMSQLINNINNNKPISKTIRIIPYDYFVATNKSKRIGGAAYTDLKSSLQRLKGTQLTTNIVTGKITQTKGFGLIDNFGFEREDINDFKSKILFIEITLSDWLYNSITSKEVLTLSKDYFKIRKPLHRRIYELARKHCGLKKNNSCCFFKISLDVLLKKSGASSPITKFKFFIKEIKDTLPDFYIHIEDKTNMVYFIKKTETHIIEQIKNNTFKG